MLKKILLFGITAIFIITFSGCAKVPGHPDLSQDSLEGRVVILDPGHSDSTPNGFGDYNEGVYMLKLALDLKAVLEERGARVLMTREAGGDMDNYARMAFVNKAALDYLKEFKQAEMDESPADSKADSLREDIARLSELSEKMQKVLNNPTLASEFFNTPFDYTYEKKASPDLIEIFEFENDPEIYDRFAFISLHSNSPADEKDTETNGANAYYMSNTVPSNKNYYNDYLNVKKNKELARSVLSHMEELGIKNRGAESGNYFMLREHNLPGILIESGFHTNEADRARLMDDDTRQELVKAIADGICEYYGVKTD